MRPTDGFGRSPARSSPDDDTLLGMSSFHSVAGPQSMSYCLADEAALNASLEQSLAAFTRPRHDLRKRSDTAAKDTHHPHGPPPHSPGGPPPPALPPRSVPAADATPLPPARPGPGPGPGFGFGFGGRYGSFRSASPPPLEPLHDILSRALVSPTSSPQKPSPLPSSRPLTPFSAPGLSGPASAFSGISSRRNSFSEFSEADIASIADTSEAYDVADDGAGAGAQEAPGGIASMEDSESSPQLVMPSIKMPSRRPFSQEGKAIGRLKVLIAGESGIGKTSLIKAIVQICEHIVHVDPISPHVPDAIPADATAVRGAKSKSQSSSSKTSSGSTDRVTEIYGSTKAYPDWWTDLGDDPSRVQRLRKNLGDSVLDRNICFVDTPGFRAGSPQSLQNVMPVVQYVESHLERMSSNSLSDSDLLALLGGEGGSQVDVVFYLISRDIKPADLQYLRLLAPLTNIIPLLARSDTVPLGQLVPSKDRIVSQLQAAGVRPFDFLASPLDGGAQLPYAISTATGSDNDVMEASLLMSSDYVQPLLPSELDVLVRQVFSSDGASWLRHSAARKYLQWRSGEHTSKPQALYRPLHQWPPAPAAAPATPRPTPSQGAPGTPRSGGMAAADYRNSQQRALLGPAGSDSETAMAILPAGKREDQLAQVRLASWAADLQRSLANERARYETIARGERAVWLTERLGECVQDGTLVPVRGGRAGNPGVGHNNGRSALRYPQHLSSALASPSVFGASSGSAKTMRRRPSPPDAADPLGLIELVAEFRAKGWVALEVLGSIGVLGGLALWATGRYWHAHYYDWIVGRLCGD
ncbi:hypothetical protein RB595_009052 [Gaeumannomyces hyphopodioides]